MTATIDKIMDLMNRLAAPRAGVLFVARHEIQYQTGCGIGRPRFGEKVLLVRATDSATWRLPESIREVAPADAFFDQAEKFGDALLVRGCAKFRPALDESKYEHCWTDAEYALHCTSNHPSATTAIKQFTIAGGGATLRQGDLKMDSQREFSAAQAKADQVYRAFGDEAPREMQGETLFDYRARLATKFQQYSKFKDAKPGSLASCGCPNLLTALEDQIYLDASAALASGSTGNGELVAITRMDAANRPITRYVSSNPGACWDQFTPPPRFIKRFRGRDGSWV
jgi:hypothetical protein